MNSEKQLREHLCSTLIGHTSANGRTEPLPDHAEAVADAARKFTKKFDAGDMGFAAGLLHDLGKAKPEFQAYLRGERQSEPHSAEGAKFALDHYSLKCPTPFEAPIGKLLAFTIAGHHAGLANGQAAGGGTAPLIDRLNVAEELEPWFNVADLPPFVKPPSPLLTAQRDPFGWAFFTRMLFSALVDADSLETERWFGKAENTAVHRGWDGNLAQLKTALDQHLKQFDLKPDPTELAELRAQVLQDCRTAAHQDQGLFSLTVPTGGGKTLSSLAFALDHAIKHNLDRVIFVIPFTSIVEQTAGVFRKALRDDDAILEHHSAFDLDKLPSKNDREAEEDAQRIRLAAQNWDRPIVVTTAVQFFESLFANKKARARKLHNIARSVVVLDEAQTLPLKLLRPCLAALHELQRGYKTSVVVCTATQPALTKDAGLKAPEALTAVKEIIQPGRNLYNRLKRVRAVQGGVLGDEQLIEGLANTERGLVIVNSRRHARELFQATTNAGVSGTHHLTTSMTAAHRQHVLERIRIDLKAKRKVRLISTSLIEAGVDISFDAVWRAWAGLDQIAQAAGRCNRENELGPQGGLLTIFEPEQIEGRAPPRELEQNAQTAKSVLGDDTDPLSPDAVSAYFRELLWTKGDGKKIALLDNVPVGEDQIRGIMEATRASANGLNFRFADIAKAFKFIEQAMVPVIIPDDAHAIAGAPKELIDALRDVENVGGIARKLQRHLVQIPRTARGTLINAGAAEFINTDAYGDQFVVLNNLDLYLDSSGLDWDDPTFRNAESNIY